MRLNHLDLIVPDVAQARRFFENHLHFSCVNDKAGDKLLVLQDSSGFVLVLSNLHNDPAPAYPQDFHIGFLQDSEQAVEEIHARFTEARIDALSPLRRIRGSLMFYCRAPGNIMMEVSYRP